MKKKIIVLGAGYAGLMAVNRLAKLNQNYKILLINESDTFVERIRNHEFAAGLEVPQHKVNNLIPNQVELLVDRVESLDPKSKIIQLASDKKKHNYDYLIYALGSTSEANSNNKSLAVNTRWKASELRKSLKGKQAGNLWILGAGLTGIELATEIKESYPELKVGLIDKNLFANDFSSQARNYLLKTFQKMDIDFLENENFEIHENSIFLSKSKTKLQADLIVQSFGFQCCDLGSKSDLKVNAKNQILVDASLQVAEYPEIFVAGDSAYVQGSHLRMGCVTAMPMGVHVAEMVHRSAKGLPVKDFSFGFAGRCVSLGRKQGLIQMTNTRDEPNSIIITGRLGAIIKEFVCKYTLFSICLEKYFSFRTYFWPKG
jgi:NADH:ubiquinone reductase (H+-translocating)